MTQSFGQYSKRIDKKISGANDTILLDTNSIISSSFLVLKVNGDTIADSNYILLPFEGKLVWTNSALKTDSIQVKYVSFPINFSKQHYRKNVDSVIRAKAPTLNPFTYTSTPSNYNQEILSLYELNKSGSISRGILVGNNRDLAVNSNFNLQLSGKLSENLNVLASISDENIPIQPQGNTAQLQDFDRIFIQLYNKDFKVIAGDFDLFKPRSSFLLYQKRAKGATAEVALPTERILGKKHGTLKAKASGAISKGKFARNVIQGQEGNQGPYKLTGNNNERYLMILSGTERIYIDGKLLKRGQENDYIIDYNTSELTFTSNQIITKDKRIVAEFQYSDQNFIRTLMQASTEYNSDKFDLWVNYYQENDNKNQPLQQQLSDDDKHILAAIGDDLDNAFTSGFDSIGYTDDRVLYALVDSLGFDSVFIYSNNPDSALYGLVFSEVGPEKGNYIQSGFDANGTIYSWVAPFFDGTRWVPQGNYEPIKILIAPEKRQMITAGGVFKLGKLAKIDFEGALSIQDKNTFSKNNTEDNQGYAFKLGYQHDVNFSKSKNAWKMTLSYDGDVVSKHFSPIERFRSVEFTRDWNIADLELNTEQIRNKAAVVFKKEKLGRLSYDFNMFNASSLYKGYKHGIQADIDHKKYFVKLNASYLTTEGLKKTNFLRHNSNIGVKTSWLVVGLEDIHERNIFFRNNTDTSTNSYQFYEWKTYISSPQQFKNTFKLFYGQRYDYGGPNEQLKMSAWAQQGGAETSIIKNSKHQLTATLTYRELKVLDTILIDQEAENSVLGRIDHKLKILKNAISFNTFYEVGSGLERKREFLYREVQPGQGNYIWVDYNEDGVKDLNEFELDNYSGFANYVRYFVLTNDFVKVYTNELRENISINFRKLWHRKKGFLKFLSRFSNQFLYQVRRKTSREDDWERFNPFALSVADTNLVSLTSSIRNTVAFNRSNPKFGMDYTYSNQSRKNLLSSGVESYELLKHETKIRWNFYKSFTLNLNGSTGTKINQAEYVVGKDYDIRFYEIEPKIIFQPSTKFRTSLFGDLTLKQNAKDLGGEVAEIYTTGVEVKYNQLQKGSLLAQLKFIYNDYNGEDNQSLAFEMLESFEKGKNLSLELNYQRNLAKNMQLSLTYLGRIGESKKVIHTGGVQIRAFF